MKERRGPKESGFTVAELLVVIAILGIAGITATVVLQRWYAVEASTKNRTEAEQRVLFALERFTNDIREAQAVLILEPRQVVLWRDDPDRNRSPSASEIIEWTWEGPSSSWIRHAPDGEDVLGELADLEIGGDTIPPYTHHVVVFISYGDLVDSRQIGTSASLRADPHAL